MHNLSLEEEKEYKRTFKRMVEFIRSLGLTVNTTTKARGHQGFFLKDRIDISTELPIQRKIEVLIHEFTHHVHYKIDPTVYKTHGDLSILFPNADIKRIEEELLCVTRFITNNKTSSSLLALRDKTIGEIKELDKKIKLEYPDFKRSYPHKKLEKQIKQTDAKYLLKYDRVSVKGIFTTKTKLYTILTLDTDFPQLSDSAKNYIKIKSKQRVLKRISSRTNKLNNYYKRPTELFARFVEALFVDTQKVSELAPHAYLVFCKELSNNKYLELADLINNFF